MLGCNTRVDQAQPLMIRTFFAASLALIAFSRVQAGPAGTLETSSFSISIEVKCEEGEVTCDHVKYVGTNKKTGESVELIGKTAHHLFFFSSRRRHTRSLRDCRRVLFR